MEENVNIGKEVSVTAERAKAIAALVITAIVNVLNVLGYAVDADLWINAVTGVLSAASVVWCWWKNQNVTEAACIGQAVTDGIKEASNA